MVLLSIDWTNLHELLRSLYDEMMPLCEDMASVAKGVAGIGALFYVAYRVWQSLSRAEEIDVFPLFRPFVLGLCIMFFPTMVLGTINGILSPVCSATSSLVEQQTFDMKKYQEEKDELEREAMLRDPAKAFLVSDEEFDKKIDELGWSLGDMDTMINMYGQKAVYDMGEKVRQWFRELLELFFQAASLLIDTLRTFFLIVLSILGPISFALAVYDGFQSTLTTWLSRYICIYLWLPVGDLFGAILSRIQVLMLQQDIKQMQASIQQKKELLSALAFYISKRVEINFSKLRMNRVSITLYDVVKSTGEVKDVFRFTYEGRDYICLSHSERIRAGLEVAELIKRLLGVEYPTFIDDVESVPVIDNVRPTGQVFIAKVIKGTALQVQVADNTGVPKAA